MLEFFSSLSTKALSFCANKLRELTVSELLEQTYQKIGEKLNAREFSLIERMSYLVASDSDEETNLGYMGYTSVLVAEVAGKFWVIGKGTPHGDYPADVFNGDIAAAPFPFSASEVTNELVNHKVRDYFRGFFGTTLILFMSDQRCGKGELEFPVDLAPYSRANIHSSTFPAISKAEIAEFILPFQVGRTVRYRSDFVEFLADKCIKALGGG